MSWKLSGSIVRKTISGRFFNNLKPKKFMSTDKCNIVDQQPDCCKTCSMMDEITHPEGDWERNFKEKDAQNNQILAIGVVLLIISSIAMKKTDVVKGYPEVTLF